MGSKRWGPQVLQRLEQLGLPSETQSMRSREGQAGPPGAATHRPQEHGAVLRARRRQKATRQGSRIRVGNTQPWQECKSQI